MESALDLGLGTILSYFIFGINTDFIYFLACILAAESLDLLQAPYLILNWKVPPFSWVYHIQHNMQADAKLPWGIITQATTVVGLVLVLQALHPLINF